MQPLETGGPGESKVTASPISQPRARTDLAAEWLMRKETGHISANGEEGFRKLWHFQREPLLTLVRD